MIRLLIGITLSEAGGSQRVVFDTIANLPEELYDVTLVTAPGGELLGWVDGLNRSRMKPVKVVALPCLRRDLSPLRDAEALLRLFLLQARGGFDAAHFHNSKMGVVGRLSARLAGVPRVYYTVHGWGLNRETTGRLYGAMSLLEKALARLTTGVVFVCESDMEAGLQHGWARQASSRLIRNGIADEPESGSPAPDACIPRGAPVIAFVARLAEPKDPAFAIRVSDALSRRGAEHRLVIVGDGPLMAPCEELVRGLGAVNRVLLIGQRGDVRGLLESVDIFCLFSRREGLPVSILEAMFAGLPVVANAVGGVPELVRHGETGFLLGGLDEEKAADCLQQLLESRDLRRSMGEAGRKAALGGFTLQGMVGEYRRLYEEGQRNIKMTGRPAWPRQYSR